MNIKYNGKSNKVRFIDLKPGDIYTNEWGVYMKIDRREGDYPNVVDMCNGHASSVNDNGSLVGQRVEATLVIEGVSPKVS